MEQNKPDIKKIEDFLKSFFNEDKSGHDWLHINRVRNTAKHIAITENISNTEIIEVASLLHEMFDYKINKLNDHKDGSYLSGLLKEAHFNDEDIKRILFIINNCSWSKEYFSSEVINDIEVQIVRDADKLDSIGAVGIARTFLYGLDNTRPVFQPDGTAKEFDTIEEYRTQKSDSTIHHMIERMIKVQDTLYTKTAQKIGKNRHEFTILFLNQFIADWYQFL